VRREARASPSLELTLQLPIVDGRRLITGVCHVFCPCTKVLLFALGGTEELFPERVVEVRPHLAYLVLGYADYPTILIVVGPVDDAGGVTAPLPDGQIILRRDSSYAGGEPAPLGSPRGARRWPGGTRALVRWVSEFCTIRPFGLVLVAVKGLETRIYTLAQGEEKDQ
jgi:hypothetical protein